MDIIDDILLDRRRVSKRALQSGLFDDLPADRLRLDMQRRRISTSACSRQDIGAETTVSHRHEALPDRTVRIVSSVQEAPA